MLLDVLEAIKGRRSIGKVENTLPPRAQIEAILEAATFAPNHYRVEPWKFVVLTGEARERLGEVFKEMTLATFDDPESPGAVAAGERARTRPLRAPVVIAVTVERPKIASVIPEENMKAVAAGIQNMLLTAHALGLGAMWRTGDFAYNPAAKAFFGLEPEDHLAGYIYVGYPAIDPAPVPRTPFREKTSWWGDEEDRYSESNAHAE